MIREFSEINLLDRNSFHVEQRAARLIEFDRWEDLHALFTEQRPAKWLVLSGGNNILFTQDYDGVILTPEAKKQLATLEALGFGSLPVCVAKTQYSFSDDATKLGAPSGFTVTVRQLKVSAGAGFVVALTGNIMTMPGLPKSPAAERIDVDEDGRIVGLF